MKQIIKELPRKTIETIVSKSALPITLFSLDDKGNVFQKLYHGTVDFASTIGGITNAYLQDTGIKEFTKDLALDVISYAGGIAEGLRDNPEQVIYGALGTYLGVKSLPILSKGVSKVKTYLQNKKEA